MLVCSRSWVANLPYKVWAVSVCGTQQIKGEGRQHYGRWEQKAKDLVRHEAQGRKKKAEQNLGQGAEI